MKPTQEQVMQWAQIAGMERCDCEPRCHLHTGGMGSLTTLATLAYEAGRKDENEAVAQMIEDAPPLVDFAKNEHGGCVICGFTPKLAAFIIRARREQ